MLGNSKDSVFFDCTSKELEEINKKSTINIVIDDFVTYELLKGEFVNNEFDLVIKYFKGKFANLSDFNEQVLKKLTFVVSNFGVDPVVVDKLEKAFKVAKPFTYEEAFKLEDETFRGGVFTTIDVTEMVNNLGKERIKTDGIKVKRKVFDKDGEFTGYVEYDNVYETYQILGDKLGLENELMYAVRCWCTSTNEEHWIWIEEDYKDEPLDAIASTFRIHENVIPHIKELKRQGDIMLVEMKKEVTPTGEIVPLTKKQYFDLLTVET